MSSSKRSTKKYVEGVPKSVARGRVLAHNHVVHGPDWPCGVNGFPRMDRRQAARRLRALSVQVVGAQALRREEVRRGLSREPERYWRSVRTLEREWGLLS